MSMDSERNHLRTLADDYFVRELTEEERSALESGLASDPDLRAYFAELTRDEWLLQHVHAVEEENVVPVVASRGRAPAWIALAACFAVLVTIGVFFILRSDPGDMVAQVDPVSTPTAVVTEVFTLSGDSITASNRGGQREVKEGARLTSGDRVVTPKSARLAVQYEGEDTTLQLGGNAIVRLGDTDGAKTVHLEAGRLVADVDPQPTNGPMKLSTRDAEAVVLGTSFEMQAGETTRLAVTKGRVKFGSIHGPNEVIVEGGFMAEASREANWFVERFRTERFKPSYDTTINQPGNPEYTRNQNYIVVDPERRLMGLVTFNLGEIDGEVREAKLRLRVMQMAQDFGGNGNVRLFRTVPDADWSTGVPAPRYQISHYRGRVGAGMDLEFEIPPDQLEGGVLPLLLTLDRKGNDFWFSSSEGAIAPELILKVVPDGPRPE